MKPIMIYSPNTQVFKCCATFLLFLDKEDNSQFFCVVDQIKKVFILHQKTLFGYFL